jgi:signal transduction histidine kinase
MLDTRRSITAALLRAVLCAALASALPAAAAPHTKKDAEAMLKVTAAFYKAHGKEKLLAAVSAKDAKFLKDDLYVVVYAMDGTMLAHPVNPALAGKNLTSVPDVDGKLFRQEFITLAKGTGSGWVDYRYLNPKTQVIEPKTAKVERLADDFFVMCGVYKP